MAEVFPGADLDRLTLGRFLILYGETGRVRRRRMREGAMAMRAAQIEDGKKWQEFMDSLAD